MKNKNYRIPDSKYISRNGFASRALQPFAMYVTRKSGLVRYSTILVGASNNDLFFLSFRPLLPYKPVKVQNVRARFRAESGFLDYDGAATN